MTRLSALKRKSCKYLISVQLLTATLLTLLIWSVLYLYSDMLGTNSFRAKIAPRQYDNNRIDNQDKIHTMRQSVEMLKTFKMETNTTNRKNEIGSKQSVYDEHLLYKTIEQYHDSLYLKRKGDQCRSRFPSCIIIGVMKSGTREIIDFMALHPNIVIKRKPFYELNYFLNMKQSLEWYKSQMPCSYENQITVTKSPLYFGDKNAPGNLYGYNKTLKMILLVREPIQRVLSALSFKAKRHTERDLSKMPAVDNQLVDNKTGTVYADHAQVKLSTYDVAMKRYMQYFSRSQILIIETEEFKKNPAKVLNEVETFLGLEHFITEDMFVYNQEKQHYCIKRQQGGMACYGKERGRTSQKPLRPITLEILKKYFDQHNEAFFELINTRYDW